MSGRQIERLFGLYFRLNGYFLTKYIVHSPDKGSLGTDIDWIALKNPYHDQKTTGNNGCDFLNLDAEVTDVIICEVKSGFADFNKALKSLDVLKDVLSWVGVVKPCHIDDVCRDLEQLVDVTVNKEKAKSGIDYNSCKIRFLMAVGRDCDHDEEKVWRLNSSIAIKYIYSSLNKHNKPETCSRDYTTTVWDEYKDIVDWFKSCTEQPTIEKFKKQFSK
ncbi:hypothetical protein [Pseudochrobactrum saccharolyticum]|uniref:hypothetical protein n=1 Tax=Pseudochrobactrum saccharolyticum TaxID=354352 RepID=UPI002767C122|nr:hypothetical protein [Pseudochrobactrum saccharolyticum]MDP8252149.1 hypothetical protein [Pseudochrobactrum saccharolyticum]